MYIRPMEVPVDVLLLVFSHLPKASLKSARLVCREFSELACRPLFASVKISAMQADIDRFSRIVNDHEIRKMVHCLIWEELPSKYPASMYLEKLTRKLQEDDPLRSVASDDEGAVQQALKEWEQRVQERVLDQHPGCAVASMDRCLVALIEGFRGMSGLRTIISTDRRGLGFSLDGMLDEPHSTASKLYFVPENDINNLLLHFQKNNILSKIPQISIVGFFCMLAALSITKCPVENLVTERASGLVKQGVLSTEHHAVENFRYKFADAFTSLRKVCVCLQMPGSPDSATVLCCLQTARQLEHLEISFTDYETYLLHDSESWLTCDSFPCLHTLVLEGLLCTGRAITRFIVHHANSLVSVALWDCKLWMCDEPSWKAVVEGLASAKTLQLESFILKSPKDAETLRHLQDGEVAARIRSEDILRFINEGGTNPFDQRHWISVEEADTLSDTSQYSDISRATFTSEDLAYSTDDPAEYDSDYDFDQEPAKSESGSESESEASVNCDMSAEDRFYYERWARLING